MGPVAVGGLLPKEGGAHEGAGLALKPPHKDWDCRRLSGGVLEGLFVAAGRPQELSWGSAVSCPGAPWLR